MISAKLFTPMAATANAAEQVWVPMEVECAGLPVEPAGC